MVAVVVAVVAVVASPRRAPPCSGPDPDPGLGPGPGAAGDGGGGGDGGMCVDIHAGSLLLFDGKRKYFSRVKNNKKQKTRKKKQNSNFADRWIDR